MEYDETSPTGEVIIDGTRYPCSYVSTDVTVDGLTPHGPGRLSIDTVSIELPFAFTGAGCNVIPSLQSAVQVLYHDREYVFPYDRFVEYGPDDMWWAEPHGFGRWRPCVTSVDGMIADVNIDPPCNALIVARLKVATIRHA